MKTELEKLTLTAELQGYRVIARADAQITLVDRHGVQCCSKPAPP